MLTARTRPPAARGLLLFAATLSLAVAVLAGTSAPNDNVVGADHAVPEIGSAAATRAASKFVPIVPIRALDTRIDDGYGKVYGTSAISVDPVTSTGVAEAAQVKADDITAVVANITMVRAGGRGFATVWPTGTERPTAATNNSEFADQNIGNLVIAPLGLERKISFYPSTDAHVTIDVLGVFVATGATDDGRFEPLGPVRHTDTRNGDPMRADETRTFDLTTAGVPADATGVVMNLTAFQANGRGFYTVWASGEDRPNTANVNVVAPGSAAGNQVISGLTDGKIDVFTNVGSEITIDITGYFTAEGVDAATDGLFVPFSPGRFLDTREPGEPTGLTGGERLSADRRFTLPLTGRGDIPPTGVKAVALNVTGNQSADRGFIKVFASGSDEPATSTLNFTTGGQTVPNHAITAIDRTTGSVDLLPDVDTHVIVDATGYFVDDTGTVPIASGATKTVDPGSFVPEALGSAPVAQPYDLLFDRKVLVESGARPNPVRNTRFSACAPIRYALNVDLADDEAIADIIASVEELERASGVDFQYAGVTSSGLNIDDEILQPETAVPPLPYRFLPPNADVLIGYTNAAETSLAGGATVGIGGGLRYSPTERMFRGFALIDIGDVTTSAERRATAIHEMGHMLGLGHVTDFDPNTGRPSTRFQGLDPQAGTWGSDVLRSQLMYPTLDETKSTLSAGDRFGLWQLYGTQVCASARDGARPSVDSNADTDSAASPIDWGQVELAFER